MRRFLLIVTGWTLLTAWSTGSSAGAAVLVFSNQTEQLVYFAVTPPETPPRAYRIAPDDVLPVPVHGSVNVRFNAGSRVVDQSASPNTIQTFRQPEQIELIEQSFVRESDDRRKGEIPKETSDADLERIGRIPVMILVDEDEPAARHVWEKRLRDRLEAASDLFEYHARIRFEVAAVGTWGSNNAVNDFALSLREFERTVRIEDPAAIAIGFTSQYKKPDRTRVHLGGTRGPLFPYLLVREWPQHVSETERLEILVHELGHVLGAVHSPDQKSVMRPLVGDRQSRAREFRIRFDASNTLAMYVFCEQLRMGRASDLSGFSSESQALLSNLYAQMQSVFPGDDSAERYRAIMRRASRPAALKAPSRSAR